MMKHRVHHLVQEGLRIWIRIEGCSLKLLDLDPGVKITQKSIKYHKKIKTVLSFQLFIYFFTRDILNSRCGSESGYKTLTKCWIRIRV
jgi:hypothetical protein